MNKINLIKNRIWFRTFIIAIAVFMMPITALAQTTVPNTFASGNTISSSEVNANFSHLADRSWELSGSSLYYSSGNVGIGTITPLELLTLESPDSDIDMTSIGNTEKSALLFRRARAGTTSVQNLDELGAIYAQGFDGADYKNAASISFTVDGSPSADSVPGDIVFHTYPEGSSTSQRSMIITSAGNVGIGGIAPSNQKLIVEATLNSGDNYAINGTAVGTASRNIGLYGWASSTDPNAENFGLWIDKGDAIFDGNVGIGTSSPAGALDVNGTIYQRGGQIHADYVFEPDYDLETIEEHSSYMWTNKHLEGVPKRSVDDNGNEIVEVGSQRKGILEELEKAHIYIEQLNNQIKDLNKQLVKYSSLEERLFNLESKLKTDN